MVPFGSPTPPPTRCRRRRQKKKKKKKKKTPDRKLLRVEPPHVVARERNTPKSQNRAIQKERFLSTAYLLLKTYK